MTVEDYLKLPYTIVVRPDEEGDAIATIQELPGCVAHGSDPHQAIENLFPIQQAWIEECIETGNPVPIPETVEELPSGKWVQRVPRTLHKQLSEAAKKEGVSLNQLVTSMLAQAVSVRWVPLHIPELLQARAIAAGQAEVSHAWGALGGPAGVYCFEKAKAFSTVPDLGFAQKLIPTHCETTNVYPSKELTGYTKRQAEIRKRHV